jgi:5'-3' exonuclease
MGIPYYFATLIKYYPTITKPIKQTVHCDVFAIDFNCLIHRYLDDLDPIHSVLESLQTILDTVCQSKIIIVAFDGLVPYGKIVQQRYRRFCKKDSGIFDRNQISPDTLFMRKLETALKEKFPNVLISPTQEPGEGEHKIFKMIKSIPEEERKSICIYGLDADLILLALFNHKLSSPNEMFLLRESSEFNDSKLNSEFSLLAIWNLMYNLPIEIEQYLVLNVLCLGNDFMPNLGIFSLREGGFSRMVMMYTKAGKPDMKTVKGRNIFLEYCASQEMSILNDCIRKRNKRDELYILGKDECFSRKYGLHLLDGVLDMEPVVEAFWKTFHCTLQYFKTNECPNWNWVYPYSDAPLIENIIEYDETPINKEEPTFSIKNQLQLILPSNSLRKTNRRTIYKDEYYTETRNPWLKKFDWEMKPRISIPWHPTDGLTSVSPL